MCVPRLVAYHTRGLVIPEHYWHAAENLEPTIAIGLNALPTEIALGDEEEEENASEEEENVEDDEEDTDALVRDDESAAPSRPSSAFGANLAVAGFAFALCSRNPRGV